MTVYLRGCGGSEVERIQVQLKKLGFYAGHIDGAFGGGTESAVRAFQKARSLTADGRVGPKTWAALFDGEEIPAPAIMSQSLSRRCLALTGSFETGLMAPHCFSCLTGDFDGQGISFGVLQWNFGQKSLQPLLKDMKSEHGSVLQDVFDNNYEELVEVLYQYSPERQMAWARSIQTADRHRVFEPWRGLLRALGRTRECQEIQHRYASTIYRQAVELHRDYGLWSERGIALMFDIVVQNGSISTRTGDTIRDDFRHIPAGTERSALEVEKMRIIARRRAEASRAEFQADVRARKLCCANGEGLVHGTHFDLEHQFGIALQEVV